MFSLCHEIGHIMGEHNLLVDNDDVDVEHLADKFAANFVDDPHHAIIMMFRVSFQVIEKFGGKAMMDDIIEDVGIDAYKTRVRLMKELTEKRG